MSTQTESEGVQRQPSREDRDTDSVTHFIERTMSPKRFPGPDGDKLSVPRGRQRQLAAAERELEAIAAETPDHPRPRTRAECAQISRPCLFVGCRYNLYLDTTTGGAIKVSRAIEPDQVNSSCVLDEAEHGPQTLGDIGDRLNITRERVRQIETRALAKLGRVGVLAEHLEEV